jgi:hypothetical protein
MSRSFLTGANQHFPRVSVCNVNYASEFLMVTKALKYSDAEVNDVREK